MELKISLLRSNPAVIRQLVIPEEKKAGVLNEVLLITMGWGPEMNCDLYYMDQDAGKCHVSDYNMKLKQLFQKTDTLYFAVSREMSRMAKNREDGWIFRIQRLEENGSKCKSGKKVQVVRFRGMNPPQELDGTEAWNRLQKYWMAGRLYFYHREFGKYHPGDYEFHIRRVNAGLAGMTAGEDWCTE